MPHERPTKVEFPPLESHTADMEPNLSSSSNNANASSAPGLEDRLRNMIVSNQSKRPSQGSNRDSGQTKQPYQALPPHMRSASPEQQREHLRKRGNTRSRGSRGSLQQQQGKGRTDVGEEQNQAKPSGSDPNGATASYANGPRAQADSLPQVDMSSPPQSPAIPPHLRGISQTAQQVDLRSKDQSSKARALDSPAPRRRMNQAERRKQQKEQDQFRLLDKPSLEPILSGGNATSTPVPSIPVVRVSSITQSQSRVQEGPRQYNAVPPPVELTQGFRPQPSPKSAMQHSTQPNPIAQESPASSGSRQFHVGPDQWTAIGHSPQGAGHFPRGSSFRGGRGSRGSRGPRQQYADQHYLRYSEGFERPQPQQGRLYDPRQQFSYNHRARGQASEMHLLPPAEQIGYLDALAYREIPNATMDPSDLAAKDNIRRVLQEICREVVVSYERQKTEIFYATNVKLECFGSISSGFATVGSDMDLALVSPESCPSTASPESEIPRLLEKVLLDCGYGARLLTQTRVPIIKFCEFPTPELREALIQKRVQWEKSLVEPPKSKRKKETGMSKANEGDVTPNDKEDDERRQRRLDERKQKRVKRKELRAKQSIADADHGQSEASVSTPISSKVPKEDEARRENVESEAMDAVSEDDDSDENTVANSGAEEDLSEPPEIEEAPLSDADEGVSREKGEEGKPHQPPSKYKTIMRSAEELIRLYQLAIKEDWFDQKERLIIYTFIGVFQGRAPDPDNVVQRHEAREALKDLPDVLSRYRDKPDDILEFSKTGLGVQCDINFSNLLAVHNTALLRCYSLCDPRIRQMVIFVKAWTKRRKVNTPYRGTLSSYGYVLMVLHYVVHIAAPPLAPNLQRHPFAHDPFLQGDLPAEIDGYDIRFWRDEQVISEAARQGLLLSNINAESLGSLLRGFFHYYAQQGYHVPKSGFNWAQDALSLRSEGGLLTKREKDWTGAKRTVIKATAPGQGDREIRHRYLFAIEDPFETDHNVARTVVHDGIVAIRDEFRRAHQFIQKGGISLNGNAWDLFEEGKELPSQRTFFGPKGRPFIGPLNLAKESRPEDPHGTEGKKRVDGEKTAKAEKMVEGQATTKAGKGKGKAGKMKEGGAIAGGK